MAKVASALTLKKQDGTVYVLSLGIGVSSTAMLFLALQKGLPIDYIVVADTGDEMKATYAFLEYIRPIIAEMGIPLIVVRSKSGRSLSRRCLDRHVTPDTRHRWCTRDVKIRPIHAFYRSLGKKIVQYIGFDSDEGSRLKKVARRKATNEGKLDITNVYPLYDYGVDRAGCEQIIAQAIDRMPIKSSCIFCPFKSTEQWVFLYNADRDGYYFAMHLEENSKHFPRQKLFVIPLRELEQLILADKPLPKSKFNDKCGSL